CGEEDAGYLQHPGKKRQDRRPPDHQWARSLKTGAGGLTPVNTLPQKMLLRLGRMSSILRCTMFFILRAESRGSLEFFALEGASPVTGTGSSTRTCHLEGIGIGANGNMGAIGR